MQFTHPATDDPLAYTDNIFRLNIKIGLKSGVLPRVMDGGVDE